MGGGEEDWRRLGSLCRSGWEVVVGCVVGGAKLLCTAPVGADIGSGCVERDGAAEGDEGGAILDGASGHA